MLEATSVAVVGASARPNSAGFQMLHQLVAGGFEGRIAPVNPKYDELAGHRCYPALDEVPFPVDLAILGVPNAALPEQLEKAARSNIASAVIFASGYEGDPTDSSLIDRLRRIAHDHGITVCGGNCMGFANFDRSLRALAFAEESGLEPGPISWITHSGSAFTALLHNDRRLRFNLAISAGQELTTTVADYIAYAVDQETTRVIALFLEAVRDPARFRTALESAARADVPVVALKVGRVEKARALVTAHSGALAGEDAVFDAVFDAYGVTRVETLNEMADTLELFSSTRRPTTSGFASVHDSGGERAHVIDIAADVGLDFADISEETSRRLAQVLEPGLPPVNPVDAWGTGNDFEEIFLGCARALAADDAVGALALAVDLAGEDPQWGYADVAEKIHTETDKPFAILSNLSSAIDGDAADRLRTAGIPILEDTRSGLKAFKHLLDRMHRAAPPDDVGVPLVEPTIVAKWAQRLQAEGPLDEVESLELIGDFGIPVARSIRIADLDELMNAADDMGYPLALKITGHPHKTEAGGVILGIGDELALISTYKRMARSFGREVVVQQMAPSGVEVALGVVRDEQFGPVVVVGAGGVLVEILRDRTLALPPLDEVRGHRLLDRLKMRPVLDGFRGAEPADVDSLVDAIARLGELATSLGDHLNALDVNPLIVHPGGAVAVDALVLPRASGASS